MLLITKCNVAQETLHVSIVTVSQYHVQDTAQVQ
jgi:hypothetical protein